MRLSRDYCAWHVGYVKNAEGVLSLHGSVKLGILPLRRIV